MPWLSYLDSLSIKLQALLLVGEEFLNILALISLKLDHLSHFSIDNDGAIASYRYLLVFVDSLCVFFLANDWQTYRTSS